MMHWSRQVWHVAKKDVRQFRWLLVLQVLATVTAVAAFVGTGSHMGDPGFPRNIPLSRSVEWFLVLAGLAVLISALVVQADSPSRSDAFWASRPLHPLSVLMSKAATLGVFLLAIPLVGEATVLWQHAVSLGEMVPMLAEALVAQAGIVVAAATLAALTANSSAFVVAALGTGVAGAAVGWVLLQTMGNVFATTAPVEGLAPIAALGAAVLVYQYSRRNLRRSVIGLTLGGILGMATVGWTSVGHVFLSEIPATASPEVARTDLQWGAFEVEPMTQSVAGSPQLWMLSTTLRLADADPRFQYLLLGGSARLHMEDGSFTHQRISRQTLSPHAERPRDIEWLFEASDPGVAGARVQLTGLSWGDVQSLAAYGGRLEIEGRVDALAVEEWGSLPLTAGAELTRESSQFRIVSLRQPGGSGPFLRFFGERIVSYLGVPEGGHTGYTRFALVNRALGEGLVVPVESRGNSHAMLLAGGSVASAVMHELDVPWVFTESGRERAVDEAWTEGAELMILSSESVGGYPIIAEHDDVRIELDQGRPVRLRIVGQAGARTPP